MCCLVVKIPTFARVQLLTLTLGPDSNFLLMESLGRNRTITSVLVSIVQVGICIEFQAFRSGLAQPRTLQGFRQ